MEEKKTVGQKVKGHLNKHKGKYITGGLVVAGVGVGVYIGKRMGVEVDGDDIHTTIDMFNPKNSKLINSNNGNVVNNVVNHIGRNGHPGNVLYCFETKQVFKSQNEAARELKIPANRISEYLNGNRDNVKGYTFEKLGEAVESMAS